MQEFESEAASVAGSLSAQSDAQVDAKKILTITKLAHDYSETHNETKEAIGRNMSRVSALALFNALGYTLRCNILVLYMRTFWYNNAWISAVTFASCIFAGLDSLVQASIADKWRFDHLIIISACLDIITYSFEAGAWNFTVIAVAYTLSGQPMVALAQGYIARVLPVKDSKEKIALFYQFFTLSYVFGPGLGGILAYFYGYRFVFWFATGVAVVTLLFCLLFVHNKQHTHESRIMALRQYYDEYDTTIDNSVFSTASTASAAAPGDEENASDMTELLPRDPNQRQADRSAPAIAYFRDETGAADATDASDATDISEDGRHATGVQEISALDENLKWLVLNDYRFQLAMVLKDGVAEEKVTRREWIIMANLILQNAIHYGVEAAWSIWYTVYLEDKYDATIIVSTCQVTLCSLFIIVSMQVVTVLGDKLKKIALQQEEASGDGQTGWLRFVHVRLQYDLRNFFVCVLAFDYIVMIVLTLVIIPYNIIDPYNDSSYVYTFWIYMVIMGLCWGSAAMAQEIVILEVQPKTLAGRVNGIKVCVMFVVRGVIGLVIGLIWDYSYEWFWYMQSISFAMSLALLTTLIVSET